VTNSKTGNPIKIFSGGHLKVRTRRRRRSFSTFIKAFISIIKFLKQKNISKLHTLKIIQHAVNSNLRVYIKNIRVLFKLLKDNKLERVKR
jgi:hypothetical protein